MKNKRLGPKWLPKLPYPYWEEFQASAKVHDINYRNQYKPRDNADFKFLQSCIEDARQYNNPKRDRMIFVAYIYYILVRAFGRISFYIQDYIKKIIEKCKRYLHK